MKKSTSLITMLTSWNQQNTTIAHPETLNGSLEAPLAMKV